MPQGHHMSSLTNDEPSKTVIVNKYPVNIKSITKVVDGNLNFDSLNGPSSNISLTL